MPSALVRKMRLPQMIGVEPAWPGRESFQATLWVSLQVVGKWVSVLMPSLVGPRQLGQLPARAADHVDS